MRRLAFLFATLAIIVVPTVDARAVAHAGTSRYEGVHSHAGGVHYLYSRGKPHATPHASTRSHHDRAYPGVKRDAHGRIVRDPHAKEAFRRSHPCPATGKKYGACPGWVVDHVQALKHGGADTPGNMQWQTRAEAKAKDRIE